MNFVKTASEQMLLLTRSCGGWFFIHRRDLRSREGVAGMDLIYDSEVGESARMLESFSFSGASHLNGLKEVYAARQVNKLKLFMYQFEFD
jgi:hypothetical protein